MRFRLAGKGDPIPGLALPDPNSGEAVPHIYLFSDGEEFRKADWIALGYTHFEVWCVGAAGGLGAGDTESVFFQATRVRVPMSNDLWAAYLRIMHYWNDPLGVHYSKWDPVAGMIVPITMDEHYEINFPAHDPYYVETYLGAVLNPSAPPGGGGGGGGVQVASGALALLDEVVTVEVGAVGVDSPPGQNQVNGAWTPMPDGFSTPHDYGTPGLNADAAALAAFRFHYPEPRDSFLPPTAGGDGGASSFGDICKASGGKGGNPTKKWVGGVLVTDGLGGQGGIGDQDTPGGGANGAVLQGANGQDGTWDGETGQGGGGGRKGHYTPPIGNPNLPGWVPGKQHPSTAGGRGSFSYAETAVHGPRQQPQPFVYTKHTYNYYTGDIQTTEIITTSELLAAGGGGGVKALRKFPYGSRAVGFNPNGAVVIRIFRVE